MPRSDLDAVPTFPLRLLHIPKPAKLIGFVLQRPFAFRFLPYDVAQAVTMSVLYQVHVLCFFKPTQGRRNLTPVRPSSLPRDRILPFFLLECFPLFRYCPHC